MPELEQYIKGKLVCVINFHRLFRNIGFIAR